jgi:predicted glycoside hydrolase/deacetylase ChbG (UPF0249 family)
MTLRSLRTALLAAGLSLAPASPLVAQPAAAAPEVLLRLDDVGMNHAVNTAVARVAASGLPFSVSVMFACPWYQEAVEILRRHPQVAVGVHLTLNSEWRHYRWGPVLGKAGAPTLVDSAGYFLPSTAEFLARRVDLGEVERELGAQVDRAMASGLKISYVDFHMGTAGSTPELRAVAERVARRYGLGISGYFGESYRTMWGTPIAEKQSEFLAYLAGVDASRPRMVEVHVAERTPEMEVLFDRNSASQNGPAGEPLVARHREGELAMVLSPEFAALVRAGKVRLVTYAQLIARAGGAAAMRRPQ